MTIKTISERCKSVGIRMTGQRRLIITVLENSKDHPDVETLFERANKIDNKVSITVAHPGITKSRQSRPHVVSDTRKSAFSYISTDIKTGTAPILEAINRKVVSAQKTFAPRIFGIYGKPTTMSLNKLVYNNYLRKKLWSYTSEELELDL